MKFTDQGRQNMGCFRIKIISRPIKIGGHNTYKIGAVLFIVSLTHLNSGNFGHGIGLIGRLQGACQQIFLPYRLGGASGIYTRATQEQQLFGPMPEGGIYNIGLNH